jgi:hypothetical protein
VLLIATAKDSSGKMREKQKVQLLLNNDEQICHGQALARLLTGADRLECMAASTKTSGIKVILEELEKSLAAGLEARFAIGLELLPDRPGFTRVRTQLIHIQKAMVATRQRAERKF